MSKAVATTKRNPRTIGLALTSALATATVALAGCSGKVAPAAAHSAEAARAALAKGKGDKAVTAAEAAVLAAPREAATRALLGAAYIEAGRFASAATAYEEAMALGDTSPRTVLTRSLALSAAGRYAEAQTLLADHQPAIDAADYGLAMTLAGSPSQGIEALSNALRYGENSPKLRQNLAYAFALKGDWRSARHLAAQDVSADKLAARLGEWAELSAPQMAAQRVATLLGVTVKPDTGQPVHLTLARFPTPDQLAAETATREAATPPTAELAEASAELPAVPATAESDALPAADALARYEAPAPVAVSNTPAAPRITLPQASPVSAPVRRAFAAKPVPAKPSRAFRAAFVRQPGAYRVQLGSYATMTGASEAWTRFQKRHPELKGAERVITKAEVRGRTYYRVAAGGFAKASAGAFCGLVKQAGGGCLAYAAARSLPGSAPRPARVAVR
ncbi:SPOR domain-containing protein [Qipengyuania sediminis]|uniref:SPOR domain-containing protein n=1 Tax=Qipengyuania sediminis TaxID=1532023 RepID=UPI0010599DBC|nr:SPOR domain-containing protein [Qipengyuania sediminis]